MSFQRIFAFSALLCIAVSSAHAHVVLEQRSAPIGQSYKGVFKITHGCQGSPTVKLTIEFPEGVIAVKPMPKPGWNIEIAKTDYARAYKFYHGKTLSSGVTRIVWSGGSLPDHFYDEFVASMFVAEELTAGQSLAFTVTQDCAQGQMKWHETATGDHSHHLEWPAPTLQLLPKTHSGKH